MKKIRLALLVLLAVSTLNTFAQTTTTTPKKTTTTVKKTVPVKKKVKRAPVKKAATTTKSTTTTTKAKASVAPPNTINGGSNASNGLSGPTGSKTATGSFTPAGKGTVNNNQTRGGANGGGTVIPTPTPTPTPTPSPNNNTIIIPSEAVDAIKQALSAGIVAGVTKLAVADGYFGNSEVKIPFPQDASLVSSTLNEIGLGSMVDKVTLSLNRAAENAAGQATPIFVSAITNMTIPDAVTIVSSPQQDAATQYLRSSTTEQLVAAFKPTVATALNTVSATKYWGEVIGEYNKIPLVGQINTDLPDYVTRAAVNGLFVMIAKEEAKIRQNPFGQTSPTVKKVFGAVKRK